MPPDSPPSPSDIEVHVRSHKDALDQDQWFVYWETPTAYGSRGVGLSLEAAKALAERIQKGRP